MRSIRSIFFSLLLACALLASFLLLRPLSVSEAGRTVPSAISSEAATAIGEVAYVTLRDSHLVALVDTASQSTLGTVDVGAAGCLSPWRAGMSPDGSHVYVSCFSSGTVAVIETSSNSVVALVGDSFSLTMTPTVIPTGTPTVTPSPFDNENHEPASSGGGGIPYADGIAFTRDGAYALVGSRFSSQIAVIDTATYQITQFIATPDNPRSLVIHPALDVAYATSSDGSILVIDTSTFTIMTTISVGSEPWDVAISPDGDWLFAGDRWGAGLAVIETGSNTQHTTVTGLGDLTGLDVAPDGSKIYAGGLWEGVHVIDGESFTYLTTIATTGQAWEVATTCDGDELYVGNTESELPVIDTEGLSVTTQIALSGFGARGIAICPQIRSAGVYVHPSAQLAFDTPGSQLVYEEHLVNATGQTEAFDLSLTDNSWQTTLSLTNTGPLSDGASISFTVQVTIPAGTAAGAMDTLTVTAASVTSPTLYSDTATITSAALCEPTLVFSGQSGQVQGGLDEIHDYGGQTFAYLNIYGYSLYNNALDATVSGYDPNSGTWQTIAEQVNGSSGLIADQFLLPSAFTQIRVQLDSFQGNLVSYDYEFIICREPAVDVSPISQQDFVTPGTTAVYTQTVTNYMMAPDSFELTASGNQWATTFWQGSTPITNTGLLADQESFAFTVKVDVPVDATPGISETVTIEATSVTSDTISDSATIQTRAIGDLAYVTLSDSNLVALVDTASQVSVGSIDVGAAGCSFPWRAAMSPDRAYVYVSCRYSGAVIVIESASNSVVAVVGEDSTLTPTPTATAPPTSTPFPPPFLRGDGQGQGQERRERNNEEAISDDEEGSRGARGEAQAEEGGGVIPSADGLAFTRDGTHALVGSRWNNQIAVIDTTSYQITSFIATSSYVRSLVTHPYLDLAYATSGDGDILIIDTSTFTLMGSIAIGGDPWDVAISPDGRWIFASDRWGAGLAVIMVGSNSLHTRVTGLGDLTGLDVAPDGSKIYVGGLWEGVHVIDGESFSHISTIESTGQAWEVASSCDGSQLYVGNTDNIMPVIDTESLDIFADVLMPGFGARGIAICPPSQEPGLYLYPILQSGYESAGSSLIYDEYIVNATGQADSFDIYLSDNSWESELSISNTGPLADGGSLSFTVEVAIPSDAEAGAEDMLTVEAASVTSPTLYSESATISTTALCSPNLVFAGQSAQGESQLDDTYEYGGQTFAYLYLYGYSIYNSALNTTVEGYDPESATWETIVEQFNTSTGLIVDQLLLPPTFTQIRVQLDSFQGNQVSYDYEFIVCREPAVDLSPDLQDDFVLPGTTAAYSQTVTNYMMAPDSFDLTVSGNQWPTSFWDGSTPITNTGLLADQESFSFTVRVEVPAEGMPGSSDTAMIQATSMISETIFDSASIDTQIRGDSAYITLSGSDLVALVDMASQAVIESIDVGVVGCSFPWRATMSPDSAYVYVSCRYSGAVAVIETASNSVVALVGDNLIPTVTPPVTPPATSTIFPTFTPPPFPTNTPTATPTATPTPFLREGAQATGQEEREQRRDGTGREVISEEGGGDIPSADGITFSRDGAYALVGSRFNSQIAVIDTTTHNLNLFIVAPANVRSLVSHPYLDLVYATSGDGKILVIDMSSFAITTQIPVGPDPWDVAISPNGEWLFVSDRDDGELTVIETSSNTVHTTVTELGEALTGLDVAPDGSQIYAGGLWEGVHVIDGESFSHITTIGEIGQAWEVAATCDGDALYVGNTENFVPVIETDSFSVTNEIDMPGFTARGIAICPQHAEMAIEGLMAINDSPTTLGESTIFSATINSGTNVTYIWDFGDGESGTGAMVEHTYTQAGSYTAVVSATNLFGSVSDSTGVQIVALKATPTQTIIPTATSTQTSTPVATATSTTTSTPMPTSTPTATGTAVAVEIVPDSPRTLTFTDEQGNNTIIDIPSGAVEQPTTLLFTPTTAASTPSNYSWMGHGFTLDAYQEGILQENFVFLEPITITIHYSDNDVTQLDEERLLLFYWHEENNEWQDAASSCTPASSYDYHADENWLTVEICHLTEFSLFGEEENILYLPIIHR